MPSQDVRLSARLSVTRQYSLETTKHILKLFSSPYSQTSLVFFHTKRDDNINADMDPLTGASNARGVKKFAIFDQYLALPRKRYQIEP